jgi:hypothetical protein
VRVGADEHEQRARLDPALLAGAQVRRDQRLERAVADELANLGAGQDLDVGVRAIRSTR